MRESERASRSGEYELKIAALTIAFAPASQVARTIIEYRRYRTVTPDKHIVAMGHYPINTAKNNRDIKLLCESFGDIELWDPGYNMGSAQTQNWVIQQLPGFDAFLNIDPDTSCRKYGWDSALRTVLQKDKNCILASCRAPLIERFIHETGRLFVEKTVDDVKYAVINEPTPFNLSLWDIEFFKGIGGIPQLGEMWGETEGPAHYLANQMGKYHAYVMDYMENEDGKFMQDRQLLEFKDLNMRVLGEERFHGRYNEYLAWKYEQLLQTDTYIAEGTIFK